MAEGALCWVDAGWAALEQERLWGSCWLLAEHSQRIARVGEFSVFDLGHRSAIIVRGEDLLLRAFVNACPHRGTRLVDGFGRVERLRCPYHAWTYALDGPLVESPGVTPGADVTLLPLPVVERFGFAWIAFSSEVEPIDSFLAPLAADLGGRDFSALCVDQDITVELACNWKLSVEVQTETLHIPAVHPEIADELNWPDARHTQLGPHARIAMEMLTECPGDNVTLYVFPNVHLNLYMGSSALLRHRPAPDSPGRSLVDYLRLAGDAEATCYERRVAALEDEPFGPVLAQDFRMAERLQRGLATGAMTRRLFTQSETVLARMYAELERRLRPGLA